MPKETLDEIAELMQQNQGIGRQIGKRPVLSNHTGYSIEGSENFEHDDTGSIMNYSGVEDDINNALLVHNDWEEGYDYNPKGTGE